MSGIGAVIGWKFNNQSGMSTVDGVITAFPDGIPTQADQDSWTTEYNTFVAANEYKGLRKKAYDSLNQFELIGDDAANGTTTHRDAIAAIKAAHPKP